MMDNQAQPGASCNPRAVAYEIDVAAGTATLLWQISNAAPGGATLGSTQQTADSVVVNWGAGQQPFLEEFAYDGTATPGSWPSGLPNSGNSYRTIKYLPTDFDINILRSSRRRFGRPALS